MGTTIGGDSRGLFGRALAPPKTAPALAPLVERLLWWNWSRFEKCLAKQLLVLVSTHGAAWSHVSWLHLSSGSRKGLQVWLLAWSCSKLNCLAGLQLEPVLELILEPCQTCPRSSRRFVCPHHTLIIFALSHFSPTIGVLEPVVMCWSCDMPCACIFPLFYLLLFLPSLLPFAVASSAASSKQCTLSLSLQLCLTSYQLIHPVASYGLLLLNFPRYYTPHAVAKPR